MKPAKYKFMTTAFYEYGRKKVTISEHLAKGESVAQPLCLSCGAKLQVVNAGLEFGGIDYFEHILPQTGMHCPHFFERDKRLAHFKNHLFDVRLQERVCDALKAPEMNEQNQRVLKQLYSLLDPEHPNPNEAVINLYRLTGYKRIYNMVLLGAHPHLLPYFLIRAVKSATIGVRADRSKPMLVASQEKQSITFLDYEGRKKVEKVPLYLEVQPSRRKLYLTAQASCELAA